MSAKSATKSPAKNLMSEFPPARENLVTLSNWRTQPYSSWSFHNVRRVVPTANIKASKHSAPLESSLIEIGDVSFEGSKGATTLRDALRTTNTEGFVVLRRGRITTE